MNYQHPVARLDTTENVKCVWEYLKRKLLS